MNRSKKIELVDKAVSQLKAYGEVCRKMYQLTGFSPDSAFSEAVNAIYENVIELTSYCIDDVGEFLHWYIYENKFGKGGMMVTVCGKGYEVKTIGQLVDIIEMYYDIIGGEFE